jgi:anaerobic magnesium-protoporphyrin IX monomethyl ester cyclase
MPHYGLAMLGTLVQMQGHQVRVADYQCSGRVPPLQGVLRTFRPDIVGLSIVSAFRALAAEAIETVRDWSPDAPIVCGGPHASCYADELARDGRIDYVVIGEAETVIAGLVAGAARQEQARIVRPALPDVDELAPPDYRIFYDFAGIQFFPLVSSRGCPYHCSFCAVHATNSKKWRPRNVAACIEELSNVHHTLPNVRQVVIWDDNFSLDMERGKQLVRAYLESGLTYPLRPANMRADRVDEELIRLLEAAGCREIQLGAEHGDPEVFSAIGKGETLDDIRRAGRIVKEHGMKLVLSFVIGLPGDSVKKTLASVRLARELKADHCYWNVLVPYKGTRVYEYFESEGRIDESRVPKTWSPANCEEWPNADTPDFEARERVKAKRIAEIFSEQMPLAGQLGFACASAFRHGFVQDLLWLLVVGLRRRIGRYGRRSSRSATLQTAQQTRS